jgi:hypothetical protein
MRPALSLLSAAVLAAAALSACGSNDSAATTPAPTAATVSFDETWVKAAETGMTAGFGVLANASDADVTLVSASSPAAPRMELHEMAMTDSGMVMRQKDGGFVVPAGGSVTLEPGGYHLMFMDITAPIQAGDEVPITLTFDDGSTLTVASLAKPFTGASEDYLPDGSASPAPTMSMAG